MYVVQRNFLCLKDSTIAVPVGVNLRLICCSYEGLLTYPFQHLRETEDESLATNFLQGRRKLVLPKQQKADIHEAEEEGHDDVDEEQSMPSKQEKDEDIPFDPCERALRGIDFPRYLHANGYRIATFTKLVATVTSILVNQKHVPKTALVCKFQVLQTLIPYSRLTPNGFCKSILKPLVLLLPMKKWQRVMKKMMSMRRQFAKL